MRLILDTRRAFTLLVYSMLAAVQFLQCVGATEPEHTVFVSILPQQYFAERIVGQYVNVLAMVEGNQSPETYEPSPRQMARLNDAILYFRIGVPFESVWIDTVREFNPQLEIVECCESLIEAMDGSNKQKHDEHGHGKHRYDPHIWTSPKMARHIATQMKEALIRKLPTLREQVAENYLRLVHDLETLDRDIRHSLSGLQQRYFIVSHPAWGYYANEYDLVQISIESRGGDIHTKSLSKLIEFAREKNIRRVFFQKQFNYDAAAILAKEIGADCGGAGSFVRGLRDQSLSCYQDDCRSERAE